MEINAGSALGGGETADLCRSALEDFGFRVVIAPSFADIFANNCVKNGVLTVVLREEEMNEIMRRAAEIPEYQVTVDLEQCTVGDDRGFSAKFAIDEFTRYCLLNGFDDIGLTLQHEAEISAYEARHSNPYTSAQ